MPSNNQNLLSIFSQAKIRYYGELQDVDVALKKEMYSCGIISML